MMQKLIIKHMRFWIAGLTIFMVVLAVYTDVIAENKQGSTQVLTAPDGSKACLATLKPHGCLFPVECNSFNALTPQKNTARTDKKTLKEVLKLKGTNNPYLVPVGDACQVVVVNDGLPNSYSVCVYIPGMGTQCFTYE